jgi:3-deoxy-D-manno-octulosonic-acid transferase
MDHLKNMNFGIKLSNAKNSLIKKEQILIIDCIGLLSSLYQYGDLAYIGGGFNKGIHNTLEAAVFGLYTIFGPKYEQFKEAKDLIENGFALSINNFTELNNAKISFAEVCPNDQIKAFCQENSGASQKSTNFILG